MTPKPIAVLAGDREQFNRFLRETHLEEGRDAIFVSRTEPIFGTEFSHIVRYGTWYLEPMAQELYRILQTRIR